MEPLDGPARPRDVLLPPDVVPVEHRERLVTRDLHDALILQARVTHVTHGRVARVAQQRAAVAQSLSRPLPVRRALPTVAPGPALAAFVPACPNLNTGRPPSLAAIPEGEY